MPADKLFLFWLKKQGIKTIFTAHNILPHDSGDKYRRQYQKYYNTVDKIIVHSSKTKEELTHDFNLEEDKVIVIPHGMIDIEADRNNVDRRMAEISSELKLENKIVFLPSVYNPIIKELIIS